jgi:hypothetical protein
MNGFKNALAGAVVFIGLGASISQAIAAPIGISTCQTISVPGSYVLTNNINAVGNCFVLTADYITLDFDGYSVVGDGTGSGIVGVSTRKGVTIRNGAIRGFSYGINFGGNGILFVVERMRVTDNANTGIGVNSQAIVRDNAVSGNAVGIATSARSLVTGNVAVSNSDGISVGPGSTIIGNMSGGNSRDGFQLYSGSTIVNNTAQANTRYGFAVECRSNLLGNSALFNSAANFQLNILPGACVQSHNLAP